MILKRHEGLLIAAAGVAAGFVVMIGTGYRVTGTPNSPIGDSLYLVSIVVLVASAVITIRNVRPGGDGSSGHGGRATSRRGRAQMAEERKRGDEERRRRKEALAADPRTRKYAERIERGEPWSDEQIAYDLDPDRVATCEHLAPIERAMRSAGIAVRYRTEGKVDARCRIDAEALRARFTLAPGVEYAEPQPQGRAYEDPLPALIRCAEHGSEIDVVHAIGSAPDVPLFPADATPDPFARLRSRLEPLARRIDAPDDALPTMRVSDQNGRPHVEIDGDTYHYVHAERGSEHDRVSTASLEELLYLVFRDVAWSMANGIARTHRKPGEDYRRELFRQQLELLRRLDPAWEVRCDAEHREVLERHPFVDAG